MNGYWVARQAKDSKHLTKLRDEKGRPLAAPSLPKSILAGSRRPRLRLFRLPLVRLARSLAYLLP